MQVLTTTAPIVARVESGRTSARVAAVAGERRRMREKASAERVGVDREDFGERVEREAARLDAVVALQDGAGEEVRARIESPEPVGGLEGRQAFSLGVARRRGRRADSANVHV